MPTVTVPLTVDPSVGVVKAAVRAALCTVTVRVGGLGSFTPSLSVAVRETVYVPGVLNVTAPGVALVLVAGEPPGKIQRWPAIEPSASVAEPAKVTDWPARMLP